VSERTYLQGTIGSYLEKLAGADPEPGGGSVAALVGALGAALVTMVTNLTLGKEKYAGVQDDMAELKRRAEEVREELGDLVTLDARAYGEVAAALQLPRDTEAQTKERRRTLQAALKGAAEVPLRVADLALEVAHLSLLAAEKGNPAAVSDAGGAALLADTAAKTAALNVRINLAWIEDEDFKCCALARIETVLSETARVRAVVLTVVDSRIGI